MAGIIRRGLVPVDQKPPPLFEEVPGPTVSVLRELLAIVLLRVVEFISIEVWLNKAN